MDADEDWEVANWATLKAKIRRLFTFYMVKILSHEEKQAFEES